MRPAQPTAWISGASSGAVRAGLEHADEVVGLEGVADHVEVTRLEDVERELDPRHHHGPGQREDRQFPRQVVELGEEGIAAHGLTWGRRAAVGGPPRWDQDGAGTGLFPGVGFTPGARNSSRWTGVAQGCGCSRPSGAGPGERTGRSRGLGSGETVRGPSRRTRSPLAAGTAT